MMFNQLVERLVSSDGHSISLGTEALAGRPARGAECRLAEFCLEAGLPNWRIEAGKNVIEKRLVVPHFQNTVYVSYALLEHDGRATRIELRPLVHFRPHDAPVSTTHPGPYRFTAWSDHYEISANESIPPLRMTLAGEGPAFTLGAARSTEIEFRLEAQRGYPSVGDQWSPGVFHAELRPDKAVVLIASLESWDTLLAMPLTRRFGPSGDLRRRVPFLPQRLHRAGLERCRGAPGNWKNGRGVIAC
jgi:hypothetical protein